MTSSLHPHYNISASEWQSDAVHEGMLNTCWHSKWHLKWCLPVSLWAVTLAAAFTAADDAEAGAAADASAADDVDTARFVTAVEVAVTATIIVGL